MSAAIVPFPRRAKSNARTDDPDPKRVQQVFVELAANALKSARRARRDGRWRHFNDDGTPRTPTEAEEKLTQLLVEITAFGSKLRQLGETNPDTFRQTLNVFKGVVDDLLSERP